MGPAQLLLMYGVIPLLIAAGLFDWLCHRATDIEGTSGLSENIYHWLLITEAGIGLAAAALLEVNAAVLLIMLGAFLAHQITTYVELRYTVPLREVQPIEQMTHSFLEILPLAAFGLLAILSWDQALALVGRREADFSLRWKEEPWPEAYLVAVAQAVVVFNLLPLAEETWRCVRALRAGVPAATQPTEPPP